MRPPLTVVMPAYNEEAVIGQVLDEVRQQVRSLVPAAEVVVVDDGSRDRTGAVLDEIASRDGQVRVIHQANAGHGPAVRRGLDAAQGEYIFLMDSDRQIPLEAFADLWKAAGGRDGAFGVRVARHDPVTRVVVTHVLRLLLLALFGIRARDANVPFKVVRRSVWERARAVIPEDTLIPSVFLAVFARHEKLDVAEVEVPHRERATGKASLRHWKLARFCLRASAQLVQFRWRLGRK